MRRNNPDFALLWDMLNAAIEVHSMIKGKKFKHFDEDKQLRYAIQYLVLTIGEAAKRVSKPCKEEHPEIPWKKIIGQRDILAHDYGEILVERMWSVASKHVPDLIKLLKDILP